MADKYGNPTEEELAQQAEAIRVAQEAMKKQAEQLKKLDWKNLSTGPASKDESSKGSTGKKYVSYKDRMKVATKKTSSTVFEPEPVTIAAKEDIIAKPKKTRKKKETIIVDAPLRVAAKSSGTFEPTNWGRDIGGDVEDSYTHSERAASSTSFNNSPRTGTNLIVVANKNKPTPNIREITSKQDSEKERLNYLRNFAVGEQTPNLPAIYKPQRKDLVVGKNPITRDEMFKSYIKDSMTFKPNYSGFTRNKTGLPATAIGTNVYNATAGLPDNAPWANRAWDRPQSTGAMFGGFLNGPTSNKNSGGGGSAGGGGTKKGGRTPKDKCCCCEWLSEIAKTTEEILEEIMLLNIQDSKDRPGANTYNRYGSNKKESFSKRILGAAINPLRDAVDVSMITPLVSKITAIAEGIGLLVTSLVPFATAAITFLGQIVLGVAALGVGIALLNRALTIGKTDGEKLKEELDAKYSVPKTPPGMLGSAYDSVMSAAKNTIGIDTTYKSPVAPQSAIQGAITDAASKTGNTARDMATFAAIESGFNPNAKSNSSSASGLYQFTKGTFQDTLKKYGGKHGLDMNASVMDPKVNALMAGEYLNENKRVLQSKLGREVNTTDLYAAHFLGAGGASKLLSSDPNADISSVVSQSAIAANPSILGGGKKVSDVIATLNTKVSKAQMVADKYMGQKTYPSDINNENISKSNDMISNNKDNKKDIVDAVKQGIMVGMKEVSDSITSSSDPRTVNVFTDTGNRLPYGRG